MKIRMNREERRKGGCLGRSGRREHEGDAPGMMRSEAEGKSFGSIIP